jgi:hypothetical protein
MMTAHNQELGRLTRSIEVLEIRLTALNALLHNPGLVKYGRKHELILERREILKKSLEVLRKRQAIRQEAWNDDR